MTKRAYIVKQRISHNGVDYNPFAYPFQQHVIFAEPYEVSAALGVGVLEENLSIPVPEELAGELPQSTTPKSLTPMLKPIK